MTTLYIPTLAAVVHEHYGSGEEALLAALTAREDVVADALRLMATQFGLYPEIVAEVVTNAIRLGTPVPEETHQHIRNQFVALMQRLQEEAEGPEGSGS